MFLVFNYCITFGKRTILTLILGLVPLLGLGQAAPDKHTLVPYTLADRERLIKLAVRGAALQNEVRNLRGDMMRLFMWGFGLVFSAVIGLISFIIWDRRSSNQKIIEQVQANKTRLESVERKLIFKP